MIEEMGVDEINEVVTAYRNLSQSPEFNLMETQRIMTEMDEAQALYNAREQERKLWESVIKDKDAEIAQKDAKVAELAALVEQLKSE